MPAADPRAAFFDERAARWDETSGPERLAAIAAWCRALPLPPWATVVDIGCGTGVSSVACAEGLGDGGRVIALDLAREMLREGRARRDHPRVRWLCADGARMPLRAGSADAIIAMHVWPHLVDVDGSGDGRALAGLVLAEWRRVLRPGGTLRIVHLIPRDRVNAIHRGSGPAVTHDILPRAADLARVVARHGFRVIIVEDDSRHYLVAAART